MSQAHDDSLPPTAPSSIRETPAGVAGTMSFPDGATVADRFRIVREIASGGMGSVYEAEDLELGERIALKSIRPDRCGDQTVDRFKREISLARRVTHPNVCRTFDLFVHSGAHGDEILLITMELLPGETLADRLRARGRLTVDEALPIALQVCSGLQAAHDAGVVHRDLKSSNIVLVPGGPEEEVRAVVADFGTARGLDLRGEGALTEVGQFLGTPAYVSPEQVRGEDVGPATDIYSLGIVFFEMVTGQRPFDGKGPLATAVKRLNEEPPDPETLCPGLDPGWGETIGRCLERRAEDRFSSPAAVAAALAGPAEAGGDPRRRFAVAVVVVALVFMVAVVSLSRRAPPTTDPTAPEATIRQLRPSVGLVGIAGPEGAEPWLAIALEELIVTELRAAGSLLLTGPAPRRRVDAAVAAEEIPDLARRFGWDVVIQGRYTMTADALDLELTGSRPGSAETLAEVVESGPSQELHRIAERAGQRLLQALSPGPAEVATSAFERLRPSTAQGARAYAEGLEALRRSDPALAREHLLRAVDLDPEFALAWLALARAWQAAGFDDKARRAASRAESLAPGLPREQRLVIEAERHRLANEWDRVEEILKALTTFFPDNPEYALELARAQNAAGRPDSARQTLHGLRANRSPARLGADPRIDLIEAEAALRLDDYPGAAELAETAMRVAEDEGSPVLAARAQRLLAQIRRRRGDIDGALDLYRAARETFAEAGDANGVASTLVSEAIVKRRQGERDQAETLYDRALSFYLQAGNLSGQGTVMLNRANLRLDAGRVEEAIVLYRRCLELYRELESRDSIALVASNLGTALVDAGRVEEAIEPLERALQAYREAGAAAGEGAASVNLGSAYLDQGRLEQADSAFQRALQIFETLGDDYGRGIAVNNLGNVARARDDLASAKALHAEALELFRRADAPAMEAHALFGLGEVARVQGALELSGDYHRSALEIRRSLDLALDVEASLEALARLQSDRARLPRTSGR